jgi:LuxR family glucitol operon transcriptional activator
MSIKLTFKGNRKVGKQTKLNRNYGYDILINNFEPSLREFIIDEIMVKYGTEWEKYIPQGVINELLETKEDQMSEDYSIEEFFEELTFNNLKDVLVFSKNFSLTRPYFGELSKDKIVELMDNLNRYRRKIAHAKSTFSELDLLMLKDYTKMLCQGEKGKEIRNYLEAEGYKNAKDVPPDFFEEYEIQNNLPPEDYDIDGGFVGRNTEVKTIMKHIRSEQDRVITITGAGGVGKTAIALKVAYSFLVESLKLFETIIWFSAKISKLTDSGIFPLTPSIESYEQLIRDILKVLDEKTFEKFEKAKVSIDSYVNYIYGIFSSNKCLFIVDNLETIIKNDALITFITEIPRPSQVLITSRKGLGEFERRYPITDMLVKDAELLFRIVAKHRNRLDLARLSEKTIYELVKRVRCYPLLIKWSIGQVCLGKDLNDAFSQIFAKKSDIAEFAFNDVFTLLSNDSKTILYSMIVQDEKTVSRYILMNLANLDDDEFEDAIKELIMTSFVFPQSRDTPTGIVTEYSMLELTRVFIENRLDDDKKIRDILYTRKHFLQEQFQDFEKSKTSYYQSVISLGIKTPEEQVAFVYVKAAKNFFYQNDNEEAEKNFKLAMKAAPELAYVLTEYSKFKFKSGQRNDAIRLAKRAIDVEPESYHALFNYGIMLRKSNQVRDSIKYFKKAKELNPKHLPIMTELGRAYTFVGKYDLAETEFNNALKEEKYPNYRHMTINLFFLGENYSRWAETFSARRDTDGAIKKLEQAFEVVSNGTEIAPRDRRMWNLYLKVCINLAIVHHCKQDNFKEAEKYLAKCIQPIYNGRCKVSVDRRLVARAYFYLAAFRFGEKDSDIHEIEELIRQGQTICDDKVIIDKFDALQEQLVVGGKNRNKGQIKFFNRSRNFGVIESKEGSFLFFGTQFRERWVETTLEILRGKEVSFLTRRDRKNPSKFLAIDVVLES